MVPAFLYALLWLGFGAGHSLLAAARGRAWLAARAGAADRLAFNLIALAHLALVLAIGWLLLRPLPGFALPAAMRLALALLAVAGLVILARAGRGYDLARFAGLAQLHRHAAEAALPPEHLATGGMNAHVRHPLYLGLLLVLWGTATTPFALATASCATLYILVGIHFEERKLARLYGEAYAAYRRRVPMLLPRPALPRRG
ncbi:MAG: isoprenylcysteine carboxylmethyltransferase family protein [Rhodospirillales bacterium]|nr:isoprenylcysteine carboxylmethyltransferase family protein [Rhodospirillales bacterium]MDE2574475.1 isoprenylcysteine carboxylmethyltransferase family protein [Rhodospirillales bacterium]